MITSEYDESFSEKEIDLIDELLSASIEKGKIKDKDDIIKALQWTLNLWPKWWQLTINLSTYILQ